LRSHYAYKFWADTHISDAVTEIMLSKLVFFWFTPIMNSSMLPSMGQLMTYIKGLKPKNRYAFTFGSMVGLLRDLKR